MAKGRVLLAHGNTDCRKIYGSVLTFDGYEVEIVSDADAALGMLTHAPFDLVVTDLYLESSGDECLLRQLRASEFIAHLPVVVITGWTTELHRRLALAENADVFLPLPTRPRELVEVVQRVLAEPRAPIHPLDPLARPEERTVANGL
jgi:two-component system sensor histidine kinase and response regulator WspE